MNADATSKLPDSTDSAIEIVIETQARDLVAGLRSGGSSLQGKGEWSNHTRPRGTAFGSNTGTLFAPTLRARTAARER